MSRTAYILSIILILIFVSIPGIVLGQDLPDVSSDTSDFSIISTIDGNTYVGKILETGNNQIIIQDNKLGRLIISVEKIKTIQAEDINSYYKFTLKNKNEFIGKIIDKGVGIVQFETDDFGIILIQADNIVFVDKLSDKAIRKGQHWFPNPNYTRYLFAPSAIPMKKGEWYYQNAYVIANSANIGISNQLTLGGGIIIPFAAYVTPKFGFEVIDNLYCAVGALYSLLPDFEEDASGMNHLGIGYGIVTYGNTEHNLTIGAGYGYMINDWANNPIYTLNGMTRVSKRIALISENWFIPYKSADFPKTIYNNELLFSYGVRFIWERFAVDAAFFNNELIFEFLPIGVPYIDFVFKF